MKISIITITYNSEKTVEETILSVINQKYEDVEYIIVDGKSTDRTLKIVDKYKEKISKIISEPDKGISDAFNKGINMATGDIIGIINSDDLLTEDALSVVADYAERFPNIDVFYGDTIRFQNAEENFVYRPLNDIKDLEKFMFLSHPSTFVRKQAYEKHGMFELKYKCAMDFKLLSKMYFEGAKFMYINRELTWFRLDGVSMKRSKLTRNESIEIAIGNGVDKKQCSRFYKREYCHEIIINILRKLKIETLIRRIVKGQKTMKTKRLWYVK